MDSLLNFIETAKTQEFLPIAFKVASQFALVGWLSIGLAPKSTITRMAVRLSVLTNSFLYAFYVTGLFSGGEMPDFGSLAGVLTLFRSGPDAGLLAAWIHYLAFDLFVGYYIALDAAKNRISRFFVAPFLFLTLMLGPAGLFSWALCRGIFGAKSSFLSF